MGFESVGMEDDRGPDMNSAEFATEQKTREEWATTTIPVGEWITLRVDGRGFTTFTAERCEKPFDENFHQEMVRVCAALMTDLGAVAGFTQSDEITVVIPPASDMFARRVEKLVSVAAGVASAEITTWARRATVFDGRCVRTPNVDAVMDVLSWRAADATRNALHSAAYWALRDTGVTARAAESRLNGATQDQKRLILDGLDRPFDGFPLWARHGSLVYWIEVPHTGVNPVTGDEIETTRRRLRSGALVPAVWRDAVTAMLEAHELVGVA